MGDIHDSWARTRDAERELLKAKREEFESLARLRDKYKKSETLERIRQRVGSLADAVENGACEIPAERSRVWPLVIDGETRHIEIDGRLLRCDGGGAVSAAMKAVQHEVSEVDAVRRIVEHQTRITEEMLAWSVFCSDRDAITFADRVGEAPKLRAGMDLPTALNLSNIAEARRDRALRIMWARNENGWADRARRRAHRMLRTLPGVQACPPDPLGIVTARDLVDQGAA